MAGDQVRNAVLHILLHGLLLLFCPIVEAIMDLTRVSPASRC